MKTLVINTGSSSIKYQLFDMPEGKVLSAGLIEKIGEDDGHIRHVKYNNGIKEEFNEEAPVLNHQAGMKKLAALLTDNTYGVLHETGDVDLVGHRVVHGGEAFAKTIIISSEVKKTIEKLSDLAPLHNPANLVGIRMAEKVFTQATQVAVFDTAFHQTIPEPAYRYAIPNNLYHDHGVRLYGFHGTSHKYVSEQAAKMLGKPVAETNLISIHLGNGASIVAVKQGKSIDTSLGMTPLPGLVMGTRSGDIDPGIIFYLYEKFGMPVKEIKNLLNKESGMKGLTGENDLRKITENADNGDQQAKLALEIYAYRIKKYIGAYIAVIGKVDALVFTAGVGENSVVIREMVVSGLNHLGISLARKKNNTGAGARNIADENSAIKILIVPTNEELEIARQAYALIAHPAN
jgi:acetate kinase